MPRGKPIAAALSEELSACQRKLDQSQDALHFLHNMMMHLVAQFRETGSPLGAFGPVMNHVLFVLGDALLPALVLKENRPLALASDFKIDVKAFVDDRIEMGSQLQTSLSRVADLERSLTNAIHRADAAEAAKYKLIGDLKSDVSSLKLEALECANLRERVRMFEHCVEALQAESTDCEVRIDEADLANEKLEMSLRDAGIQFSILARENSLAVETICQLERELRSAKEDPDVEDQISKLMIQNRIYTKTISDLEREVSSLREDASESTELMNQLRRSLSESAMLIQDLMSEKDSVAKTMTDLVPVAVPKSWDRHHVSFADMWVLVRDHQIQEAVLQVLTRSAHGASHAGSGCPKFRNLTVNGVYRIENVVLWRKYMQARQQLRSRHEKSGVPLPPLMLACGVTSEELAPMCHALTDDVPLLAGINEFLLFHGTSRNQLAQIAMSGFDVRLAKRSMYGAGTYFASESCKAHQYASQDPTSCRALLIARVTLGNFVVAKNAQHCSRARRRANDSVVVYPGPMPGHYRRHQAHQEFVILDSMQAYPLYAVNYSL